MTLLDDTMGVLLVGIIISAVFYGVSCSQMYYYYTSYHTDPWHIKLLVTAVWTTDTIHQALISHSIYWYLVTEYGNPHALALLSQTIIIEVLFNAFTGFFVQSFFVARVWKLSEKKLYLAAPVAILVAAEFGVSVAYTIRAFYLRTFVDLAEIRGLSICMNVFAAAADVAIAAILCTLLHNSRTNFTRSNTLINKLIVFAVNTGLLTSVCACISLITFFAAPESFTYICFYFLIGRLYSNSLMATLNARKSMREASAHDVSLSLQDMQPVGAGANLGSYNGSHDKRRGEGITIRIDTTKSMKRDGCDADIDVDLDGDNDASATDSNSSKLFDSPQKHTVEEV